MNNAYVLYSIFIYASSTRENLQNKDIFKIYSLLLQ